jgi:arylsulfatase A-like enzyme
MPYDALWAPASQKEQFKTYTEKLKKEIAHPFRRNRGLPTVEELRRTDVNLDEFVAFEHNWYDGSIRGMNAEVGRVLERLRELGLDEKTLVIFRSRRGGFSTTATFHGQSVYSELTHVPLAFRWPG